MSLAPEFLTTRWRRVLATAALLAFFFGNKGFRSLAGNGLELRRLRHEIVELNSRQQELNERLELIESGGSSLEGLARVQLGYIKKGEIEYRFPPPDPSAP